MPVTIEDEMIYSESLEKTPDGGFIVSGYVYHEDSPVTYGLIVRFDQQGNRLWWRKYEIEGYTQVYGDYAIQQDGGSIIMTGSCWEEGLPASTFIFFIDSEGNLTDRVLHTVAEQKVITDRKLFLRDDGTIILAKTVVNDEAVLLTERTSLVVDLLDDTGEITESREYENTSAILDQTFMRDDGYIFLAGVTRPVKVPESLDDVNMLFLLINDAGDEVYRISSGTNSWDNGLSVAPAYDGGFNVAGSLTYDRNPVLLPVSASGIQGEQVPVADTIHTYGLVIKQTGSNEYLLVNQSRLRVYFSKLRSDLSVKWITWFDNPFSSDIYPPIIRDMISLSDGSFAFLYWSDALGYTLNKTISFN